MLATLAPGAVLMPAGQRPQADLNAIRGFWWPSDGSRTRITAYTSTIDEIGGGPDWAYVRGTGQLAFTYEKDAVRSQVTSRNMTLTIVTRGAAWARRVRPLAGTTNTSTSGYAAPFHLAPGAILSGTASPETTIDAFP